MEIRDYKFPNWFTPEGVRMMRNKILAKGVPDMTNWRFITLTLNPDLFVDEVDGYFKGLDRLRRFNAMMKMQFGDHFEIKHCWKMEFHGGNGLNHGWVHWHMAMSITRKLTVFEMQMVSEFWGLGRVNIKRIEGATLDYMFKYLFKNPDGSNSTIPDWFADYQGDDGKTFDRARFWQTSPHFYTGNIDTELKKKLEPKSCLLPWTVRAKLDRWACCVVLIARDSQDRYLGSQVTRLKSLKSTFFTDLNNLVFIGKASLPYNKQYYTAAKNIEKHIESWQKNLLSKDRQGINRMKAQWLKCSLEFSKINSVTVPA
ncbi:MAG: hypothetical protein QM496_05715 [Verrucomicrobiota bacterium]